MFGSLCMSSTEGVISASILGTEKHPQLELSFSSGMLVQENLRDSGWP